MSKSIKIKLAQINFVVGDLDGNFLKICKSFEEEKNDVDLVVFSELSLTGYPPEDLLCKKYFIQKCEEKILELSKKTLDSKCSIIVGSPNLSDENKLFNSVFLLQEGKVKQVINKVSLPNYGVFDEKRYFAAEKNPSCIDFKDFKIAVLICEDIWSTDNSTKILNQNPDLIICSNASPFSIGKYEKRIEIVREFSKDIPTIYLNQIGGQDSLVFDGSSFVADLKNNKIFNMAEFCEDSGIIKLEKKSNQTNISIVKGFNNKIQNLDDDKNKRLYQACILGLRDYVIKNGFKKVLIGMSGGIDSALVSIIAVDALGSENVKLINLPSKFNLKEGIDDSFEMAKNIGVDIDKISIESIFNEMILSLNNQFLNTKPDVTEENLQSRIRGNILMAISNKFGHLLITTGNKSEMATGYATIYGDMCGAFNPIKDLYKTQVFNLCNWRNKNIPEISYFGKSAPIPQNIITKEPSAELRENQKDSDSLPKYEILDQILFNLIEEEKSVEDIISLGFEASVVERVARLFYLSEYKRKQSVIGVKLSKMSFDKDRRYPITNLFKI